jgi:phage shock protein A
MSSDLPVPMQSNLPAAPATEDAVILSASEGRRRISTDPQPHTYSPSPTCDTHPQQTTVRLKQRSSFMGLLERVSTLIRANINDVIDRAEDPEKMIKQVILDMENQYMQVKTQVAVSIADQHMLEKKQKENEDVGADWMRKAERAVDKQQDDLARAALDRYQTSQRLAQSYREQVDDQKIQVEALKGALMKLEQKLDEAKSKRDMLIARHRRSVALNKAAKAQNAAGDGSKSAAFDRLKDRVNQSESVASAELELNADEIGERLNRMDRDAEVERLLTDLKQRRLLPG